MYICVCVCARACMCVQVCKYTYSIFVVLEIAALTNCERITSIFGYCL